MNVSFGVFISSEFVEMLCISPVQTRGVTWHGEGGRGCLCFGSKGKLREERKGGDVTGLLNFISLSPTPTNATSPQRQCVNKYQSGAPPGSKRRLALRYRPSPDVNRQLVVSSWLSG